MNILKYIHGKRKEGVWGFRIEALMEECGVGYGYARVMVHRGEQSGDLVSPARGFYVIVPPEEQVFGCIPAAELVVVLMDYLKANYYVSCLSGGLYYGASHQKPARFQVVCDKRIKHPMCFGRVAIEFIYKKKVEGLPVREFGVRTGNLRVGSPELVAYDLVSYIGRCGGLNHVATVLSELIDEIDGGELVRLLGALGAGHQAQRLGYILERVEVMDEQKKAGVLMRLREYVRAKVRHRVKLASELGRSGYPCAKAWKVIENTEIESDL